MAAPPHASELAIKRDGHMYLTTKTARLLLPILGDRTSREADREFVLPDGSRVVVPTKEDGRVVVQGKFGEISLPRTLKVWGNDDSMWRDHAFKNYILGTYNNEQLSASLTSPVVFKGVLLAILTTRSVRGSGNNIKSQQLVRVEDAPTPQLTMLRWHDVPIGGPYFMPASIERIFVTGNRLLLFANPVSSNYPDLFAQGKPTPASELEEIDSEGKTLRIVGRIPGPIYPIGIISDRCPVFGAAHNTVTHSAMHPVWLYDLKRNSAKALLGNWKAYDGIGSVILPEPRNAMNYLLWRRTGICDADEIHDTFQQRFEKMDSGDHVGGHRRLLYCTLAAGTALDA